MANRLAPLEPKGSATEKAFEGAPEALRAAMARKAIETRRKPKRRDLAMHERIVDGGAVLGQGGEKTHWKLASAIGQREKDWEIEMSLRRREFRTLNETGAEGRMGADVLPHMMNHARRRKKENANVGVHEVTVNKRAPA